MRHLILEKDEETKIVGNRGKARMREGVESTFFVLCFGEAGNVASR